MTSPDSWYVQTGFGTILGPMPTDALFEMVRTGALIGSDLARADGASDWEPVANIEEHSLSNSPKPLIRSNASILTKTTNADVSTSQNLSRETHSEQQLAATPTPALSSSQKRTSPTNTVAYAFSQPAETQPAQEVDIVAKWKAERQRRPKRQELKVAEEIDETQSLADQIDREVTETELEPIPDIFSEDLSSAEITANAPETMAACEARTDSFAGSRQAIKLPSLLSQVAPDLRPRQIESFKELRNRWLRSLPSKPVIAVLAVILFSTYWLWPRSNRPVFDRLVAIWSELQSHRDRPLDKSGMDDFVVRAEAEITAIIPKLNRQSTSNSREATLLLRVSRDCLQPMLKRPREKNTVLENKLNSHLQELAMYYGHTLTDTLSTEMKSSK